MKKIIDEVRLELTIKDLEDMIKNLQIARGYAPLRSSWDEDIERLLNRAYDQLEELKQFSALLGYSEAPTKLGIIEDVLEDELISEGEDDIDWDDIMEALLKDVDFDEEEEA